MNRQTLEKTALELIKQGVSREAIESKLNCEFMFNKDAFTNTYISTTLWKRGGSKGGE